MELLAAKEIQFRHLPHRSNPLVLKILEIETDEIVVFFASGDTPVVYGEEVMLREVALHHELTKMKRGQRVWIAKEKMDTLRLRSQKVYHS